MLSHNQSLILRRNPGKHLDPTMQKLLPPTHKLIIHSIRHSPLIPELKIIHLVLPLYNPPLFLLELYDVDAAILVEFAALEDYYVLVLGDHMGHQGCFYAQEDVVASYYFGVDGAVG